MTNNVAVGLGQLAISDDPDVVLVAYGLGSCLGIIAYDPAAHRGGLLHAVLPAADANGRAAQASPAKYVDSGLEQLLAAFRTAVEARRLSIKVIGGANMFQSSGLDTTLKIGERNLAAAQAFLAERNLPIVASQTGGNFGRTARLYIADGRTTVRSMGQPEEDF